MNCVAAKRLLHSSSASRMAALQAVSFTTFPLIYIYACINKSYLWQGGENMTIAKSSFLHHSVETLSRSIPTATAATETKKMNMCQAVNNAMDIALEKIETTGKLDVSFPVETIKRNFN